MRRMAIASATAAISFQSSPRSPSNYILLYRSWSASVEEMGGVSSGRLREAFLHLEEAD
jgi:hypothetical protein